MVDGAKGRWARLWSAFAQPQADFASLEAQFPTEEELREDPDFNRQQAAKIAERLVDADRAGRDAAVELSKWLLTSLLALNAGGMVAVSQLEMSGLMRFVAGAIFLAGVALPLFAGHLSVKTWFETTGPLGGQIGYWQAVEHNGFRIRETEIEMLRIGQRASRRMTAPYILGYMAMLGFIAGSVILGVGMLLQ